MYQEELQREAGRWPRGAKQEWR